MGRLQQITAAFGLVACVALSGGCIHVHRDADGKLKSMNVKAPAAKAPEIAIDPDVKQAGATVPGSATAASIASLAKIASQGDLPKGSATEIAIAWQNKIAYLPDPTRNGANIGGVVGQMFLFAPGYQPAQANGKLVIEMYDATRAGAADEGPRLGTWTFDKDTLRRLVTMDERFGKCYALFLPWPDYRGDVTKLKLKTRYEPERGYPLYSQSPLTLDTSAPGSANVLPAGGFPTPAPATHAGGFMGTPPNFSSAPRATPPLDPLPVGARSATGAPSSPLPANLPPLVITATGR